MQTFHYQGIDKAGYLTTGIIQANNPIRARVTLYQQGISVQKIQQKSASIWSAGRKITQKDISLFARQLATMIQAGLPLVSSFDIVAKSMRKEGMHDLILSLKNAVEIGLTLTESFKKHPKYFNELFCNLVDAGEKSGSLEIMLAKIAQYRERMENIRKKIYKALAYPATVLIIALAVTLGLLLLVVPQFEAVFQGLGAELPLLTKNVIYLSAWMQSWWYILGGLLLGILSLVSLLIRKSPACAALLDKILLKIPLAGSIIEKSCIARFSRTLCITVAAGLPLVDALQVVAGATGNALYKSATETICREISHGQTLHAAIENTRLFPNMVVQMVAIGEESGTLERMLEKIASFFEEEADAYIDYSSNLLEPLIMCILGVLTGSLVLAMYMPIFKLGSVV